MTARVALWENMSYTRGFTTKAVLYVADTRYQMEAHGPLYVPGAHALNQKVTVPLLSELAASVQWSLGAENVLDWGEIIQDTYAEALRSPKRDSDNTITATVMTLQNLLTIFRTPRPARITGAKIYEERGEHVVEIPPFEVQEKLIEDAKEELKRQRAMAEHAAVMLEFEKNILEQDKDRKVADERAQVLFDKTFPGLDPSSNPKFESKKMPGVQYRVDSQAELFYRHGLIKVLYNGQELGQLCCVVDSTRDSTPGTDVLLQKCLLLRYDEYEIWKYSNWFPAGRQSILHVDPRTKLPKIGSFKSETTYHW